MKIWIRGVSCSGKTELSKLLCQRFGLVHIELDALYWLPGWQCRKVEEYALLAKEPLQQDNWVLDGNYDKLSQFIDIKPDYLIWLNYPLQKVIWRCLKRTISRIIDQKPICNGNRETFLGQFSIDSNMLLWVLRTFGKQRERLKVFKTTNHNIIEVKRERDIDKFIDSIIKTLKK